MKPSILFKLVLSAIVFCTLIASSKAQTCGSCTENITGRDTLSYTVTTGQTFCIDTMGIFEGVITVSGGNVCNRGLFNPKTIVVSSGTINNYSNMIINSSFTLTTGATLFSDNSTLLTFRGDITISGGTVTNNGIANVKGNIAFNSGTFSNSSIINCRLLSGANVASITNSGIINKD